MSARSFRRSHAKRVAREGRRLSNAKRRALVAGATLGASAVLAANAEAATYTVTTTADSGPGSLRDAINTANTNGVSGTPDTITFAPGVTGTITLTSGQINITDPGGLTIEGPGAGSLSVSGGGNSGIFHIQGTGGAPVAISGLTLEDGAASGSGGAIYDESSPLTVSDSTITHNTATGLGGGIFATFLQTKYNVTVTNSTVSGNTAAAGGGGIATDEYLSVSNSQIIGDNHTTGNVGGGILEFGGSLSLTGSTVSGNVAANGGGGIAASGKYAPGKHTPVLVQDSTIADNQAPRGAGIELGQDLNADSPITIKGTTISGNPGGANSFGGGVLLTGEIDNPFDLVNSTITGNTATDGAGVSLSYGGSTTQLLGTGGSISFDNSTIDGNTADTNGGGIYLGSYTAGSTASSGTAAINSTIVAGDTANGAPNDLYQADTTAGGFNDTFSLIQEPGNAKLLSSQALITGLDAQLNALANNGGPTETMLPKDTSPVIDQGKAQSGLTSDQRGDARTVDRGKTKPPGGDGTDIGAVELPKLAPPTPPASPPPSKPASISVTVGPASGILDTSAILNGTIKTTGQAVTWHFEYGTSTAYGKVTPTKSISAGNGQVPVSFKVSGLKPGTRYHYRVVGVSAAGQTATSTDATFKTPAPTIKVTPGAVRAAHAVRFAGSAGACTRGSQVTLISSVFSPAHKFHGRNAIHARVGAGNKYSVVTRIPAGRKPGRYAITARCDGATFGVTAFLRVLPPPPVVRFTG